MIPRLFLVGSAVLWSLSGALAKTIALPGPTMAAYRAFFAAVFLILFLPLAPKVPGRVRMQWRPALIGMVLCFTLMNLAYLTAMTLTTAANAIFLQCTAPVWTLMATLLWLREPLDRKSLVAILIGLSGMAVIAGGGWSGAPMGIALALASGVFYGLLTVFLRYLRDESPLFLTVVNHAVAAVLLWLLVPAEMFPSHLPWSKLGALAFFGIVQMGIPYLLYASALRKVSPQEAGVITLIEPVLNPINTYFAVGEIPASTTVVGGAIVLFAVAFRYAPISQKLFSKPSQFR